VDEQVLDLQIHSEIESSTRIAEMMVEQRIIDSREQVPVGDLGAKAGDNADTHLA